MATTSSTPADKAIMRQGGKNTTGRRGLAAKLPAWALAFGCVATLALGGLRVGEALRHQSPVAIQPAVAPAPWVNDRSGPADEYLLVDSSAAPDTFIPDQFTYREDRRAPGEAPAPSFGPQP
jgi:hypothetical protein